MVKCCINGRTTFKQLIHIDDVPDSLATVWSGEVTIHPPVPTHPGHLRQRHEPVVVAVDLRPHPPPQRAVLGRAQVRQPRVDPLPVDDGRGGHGAGGHVSRAVTCHEVTWVLSRIVRPRLYWQRRTNNQQSRADCDLGRGANMRVTCDTEAHKELIQNYKKFTAHVYC